MFSWKLFPNSKKERYVFKEQSEIRLATMYIPQTSIHMHILIWLYDLTLSLDLLFDFTTYVLQVFSFMFSPYLWTTL
jgi:hypothetical protein